MKPLVDRYGIGLTCDPENIDDINACIERMRTDRVFYDQCKQNLRLAKSELCWEKEKENLRKAYQRFV
jgi:hypothetical protein